MSADTFWLDTMIALARANAMPVDHDESERQAYNDEAREAAYAREERDRAERETGRPR